MVRPVVVAACLGLVGCERANTIVPRTTPFFVVHAILDPTTRVQTVMVERSLTGAVNVSTQQGFNSNNPIVTGGGEPVVGADVRITDPDGVVMQGTPSSTAPGVYQINLNTFGVNLKPGRRYSLRVTTGKDTVTGTTLLPAVTPALAAITQTFNRDHGPLKLSLPQATGARAYWVQVEAPLNQYILLSTDRDLSIAGDARNLFTDDLLKIFYPGFLELMTAAAIDTNVYDYYRSGNDPFTGSGFINHLKGGQGLFGSLIVVDSRQLDVTQDSVDAIDGVYTSRTSGVNGQLTLYREALGGMTSGDRITGTYRANGSRLAVMGSRSGTALGLDILSGPGYGRITGSFFGTVHGDTVSGTLPNTPGGVVFVRAGK